MHAPLAVTYRNGMQDFFCEGITAGVYAKNFLGGGKKLRVDVFFWEGVYSRNFNGDGGGGVTEVASAGFWSGKRTFCKVEQDFF